MEERFVTKNGYRKLHDKHTTYIESEHRKIAYQKIYLKNRKQYPRPFEEYEVHHVNHNRNDNRPSNLRLLLRNEHQSFHRK